jgi:hypothetical protein
MVASLRLKSPDFGETSAPAFRSAQTSLPISYFGILAKRNLFVCLSAFRGVKVLRNLTLCKHRIYCYLFAT